MQQNARVFISQASGNVMYDVNLLASAAMVMFELT